jgi:hypothetical protein
LRRAREAREPQLPLSDAEIGGEEVPRRPLLTTPKLSQLAGL